MTENQNVEAAAVEATAPTGNELTAIMAAAIAPAVNAPRMSFTPEQYKYSVGSGSGAAKLASSGVAPLVAAARGYRTITADTLRDEAQWFGALPLSTPQAKSLKRSIVHGDSLGMPWYGIVDVAPAATAGTFPERPTSFQTRPSKELVNADGKTAKYLLAKGNACVLDMHPATPGNWISGNGRVLLAEGLLKADSAQTAQLIAAGATEAELLAEHGGNQAAALEAMRALMEKVENPAVVVGLVGCSTWHRQANDWNSLPLRGRTVLVGLDGDVRENPDVWNQGAAMVSFMNGRHADEVQLVNIPDLADAKKPGLDDYFTAVDGGTWADLDSLLGDLPEAPDNKRPLRKMKLAKVDMAAGLTYETVLEADESGTPRKVDVPLANVAVTIHSSETVHVPWADTKANVKLAGEVSWSNSRGEVSSRSFQRLSYDDLHGRGASVAAVMPALTKGAGIGVITASGREGDVLMAWRATAEDATYTEVIESTGLWEHTSGLGWLTMKGMLSARGLVPDVRGRSAEGMPDVTTPWMDAEAEPRRVTDAWEEQQEFRKVLHPGPAPIWVMVHGAMCAASLGLQPKVSLMTFMDPGMGKSFLQRIMLLPYGEAFGARSWIKLEATESAFRGAVLDGNNMLLGIDDSRPKMTERLNETMATQVDNAIREGHEPGSMKRVRAMDAHGRYVHSPVRPHSVRVPWITGEDIHALGLPTSTVQRALGVFLDPGEELAVRGSLGTWLERLSKSGTPGDLLGALIVSWLRKAEGEDAPRQWILDQLRAIERAEAERFGEALPEATVRDMEGVSAMMAGMTISRQMVAEAYTAQGRHAAAAEVLEGLNEDRAMLAEAWRRHQRQWAKEAQATQSELLDELRTAVAVGDAVLYSPTGAPGEKSNVVMIGREVGDSFYLLPSQALMVIHRRRADLRHLNMTTFGAQLKPCVEKKSSVRVGGPHGVTAWKIPLEKWLGIDVPDASEGVSGEGEDEGNGKVVQLPSARRTVGMTELSGASGW